MDHVDWLLRQNTEPPPRGEPKSGVHKKLNGIGGSLTLKQEIDWCSFLAPVDQAWFYNAPKPRTWLLRDNRHPDKAGVLPLGKAGQLIAEGGAGKTMAIIQLALAVATGTDWLGTFSVASPGRVLLLLGEEDQEEVHRRIYAASRELQVSPPSDNTIMTFPLCGQSCSMLERDESGNASETDFLRWMRDDYLRATRDYLGLPLRLIVLDPLSRFGGPDVEKDNAVGTRFIEVVESLSVESGATSLVNHHTNQVSRGPNGIISGASSRGVTSLHDGFRWQSAFAQLQGELKGTVSMTFTKSNYSLCGDELLLRRLDNGGALVPLTEEERIRVAAVRSGEAVKQKKGEEKESIREQRERAELERKAQLELESQRAEEAKLAREDAAVEKILMNDPPKNRRELYARMRNECGGCSHDRADAALLRWRQRQVKN